MSQDWLEKYVTAGDYAAPGWGPSYVPIHGGLMEKVAGELYTPQPLADVIAKLRPRPEGRYILLHAIGAYEYWGCFPAGTLVETGDGDTAIDKLTVGQLVRTHTGQLHPIVNVQRYENKTKRVRLRVEGCLDEIETTVEHPFLAHTTEHPCLGDQHKRCLPPTQGKQAICRRPAAAVRTCAATPLELPVEWVRAADLKAGDYATYQLPEPREVARVSEAWARLAGLFLAEGSFMKRRNGPRKGVRYGLELSFGIHEETTLAAETLALAADLGWSARCYLNEAKSCASVRIKTGEAVADTWYQAFGEYSHGKRLPSWIFTEPEAIRGHLLGGLLDGDGCFNIRGKENRGQIRLASRQLIQDTQRLIWSLGAPAAVLRGDWGGTREHYQLTFALSQLPALSRYSTRYKFRPLTQSTKARGFVHKGRVYLPIRSVELYEDRGSVYNIEVDIDHSYVAGGVAVHNCNRNGDAFPEWSLRSLPPPASVRAVLEGPVQKACAGFITPPTIRYGYSTFVAFAHVYRGHANQDPLKACGDVIASAYNERMHRVELIVFVYTDRAPDIVDRIDRGEPVAWSMGAKLPFDVCSICGNVARTRAQYCTHLLHELGMVYPDGRKVFSYNFFPRFFDISEVGVPADRSAWTLAKVAGLVTWAGPEPPPIRFVAKLATIEKRPDAERAQNLGTAPIDPKLLSFIRDTVRADYSSCDELPDAQLQAMKRHGLARSLAASALMGIMLKQSEVEKLASDPAQLPNRLEFASVDRTLMASLGPVLQSRSLFEPFITKRAARRLVKQAAPIFTKASPSPVFERYVELIRSADLTKWAHALASDPVVRFALDPNALETELTGHNRPFPSWLPFVVGSTALF